MGHGGPKTEAGKAASSRNALRHGLLSEAPVTTRYETMEEWSAHRRAMLADLQPRNHAESCLAERAALLQWRLRRVPLAEAELCDREAAEQGRHYSAPSNARRDAFALFPAMNALERLMRYEAHLGRELARTLKALHDLQSRPAAEVEPAAKTENCETNSPPSPPARNGGARPASAPAPAGATATPAGFVKLRPPHAGSASPVLAPLLDPETASARTCYLEPPSSLRVRYQLAQEIHPLAHTTLASRGAAAARMSMAWMSSRAELAASWPSARVGSPPVVG